MAKSEEDERKSLRNEIDNYLQTINAIVSFCHILVYDFSGKATTGKYLTTSDKNEISPNVRVTPDIVGQIGNYGIVGEVKKTLPKEISYQDDALIQIKKYDDCLTGWFQKKEGKHDIAFITHLLRSRDFIAFLEQNISNKNLILSRKLTIISSVRSTENEEFFILRKEYGGFSHKELDEKLAKGVGIPFSKIIPKLMQVKFYDCEPPVAYTMDFLWSHIFSFFPTPEEFRKARGKTILIKKNIDEIFNLSKKNFAPEDSDIEIPRKAWIRDAMEKFVAFGLAERIDEITYKIYYRNLRVDEPLDFFVKKIVAMNRVIKLDNFS